MPEGISEDVGLDGYAIVGGGCHFQDECIDQEERSKPFEVVKKGGARSATPRRQEQRRQEQNLW